MTENSLTEGWGFPNGARKCHYFRDQFALCRRYGFYRGPLDADDGKPSRDDCTLCRKAITREQVGA